MKIIPAIDLLNGKVVRLTEGDYGRAKSYEGQNLAGVARACIEEGIDFIHVVDLNGARGERVRLNEAAVFSVLKTAWIGIQFGGGIRSAKRAKQLLDSGIQKVIVGTAAITKLTFLPELRKAIPPVKVVIAADVLNGALKYEGWQKEAGIRFSDFISSSMELGFHAFLITSIKQDGTLEGPDFPFYGSVKKNFPGIKLIASGGVSSMKDIAQLSETGVDSVVVGKAIYEGRVTLREIAEWNRVFG